MTPLPSLAALWRRPAWILAYGGGVGLMPKAPGTFGTLLAIPLYLAIAPLAWFYYALVLSVAFALGCWCCENAAQALGEDDHPSIVWDEIVGFCLAMYWTSPSWLTVLIGFALFRLFDILKPWPIGWLDRNVHGGLGIMLDDAMAGFYTLICLQLGTMLWWYLAQFN